jgi:hypothetical protein
MNQFDSRLNNAQTRPATDREAADLAEIPVELHCLNSAAERLYERIDVLTARLDPVLRSAAPSDKAEADEAYPDSGMAIKLRSTTNMLNAQADRLNALIVRLAL